MLTWCIHTCLQYTSFAVTGRLRPLGGSVPRHGSPGKAPAPLRRAQTSVSGCPAGPDFCAGPAGHVHDPGLRPGPRLPTMRRARAGRPPAARGSTGGTLPVPGGRTRSRVAALAPGSRCIGWTAAAPVRVRSLVNLATSPAVAAPNPIQVSCSARDCPGDRDSPGHSVAPLV